MASHQGMLTLVLTVTLVVVSSSGTMLTVTPSSTNMTCPTENLSCLTLSEYAQHHSEYFNHSNITLQFLPGNHTLDMDLTITSIQTQYLEILGNTTSQTPSTITCSHKVGFEFRDISKVRVSKMTFISCGRGYQSQFMFHYTIRFSSVQLTEIANCVFHDSFGTAVGIVNSATLVSGNNNFSSNCRKCSGGCPCLSVCFGGGITAEGSNVTFYGNNTFHENSAKYGGGVYANNSNVTFHDDNTFHENSASVGGGVGAWNSNVRFSGTGTFTDNTAQYDGEGIYSVNSSIDIGGITKIQNNTAQLRGGGIYSFNSNIDIGGITKIQNNTTRVHGGGIYSFSSNIDVGGITEIQNNTAQLRGGGIHSFSSNIDIGGITKIQNNTARVHGGGIYSFNSNIDVGGITEIQNNTAQQDGGGIYMRRTYMKLAGINTFTTNSAMQGGGILAAAGSTVVSDGMNVFIANRADISGGGILVDSGTLILNGSNYDIGGGVYAENSNATFHDGNTFHGNSANFDGGGVYALHSNVRFSGIGTFADNTAQNDGGGIYSFSSNIDIGGITEIQNNTAQQNGGGICSYISSIDIGGITEIQNNTAQQDGGGIYSFNSDIDVGGITEIQNNTAQQNGGGICSYISSIDIGGITEIQNNTAQQDGGGICMRRTYMKLAGINTFTTNSAMQGGGILAAAGSTVVSDGMNVFIANRADISGGGILVDSGTLILNGSNYDIGGGVYAENSNATFHDGNTFHGNSANFDGGGVLALHSNVRFSGTGTFTDNTARYDGGGICSDNSTIDIGGNTRIQNNTALDGGGIYMRRTYMALAGINKFTNNSAMRGGGILAAAGSTVVPDGMNDFIANRADISGGGILVDNGNLNLIGSNYFEECTARYEGGGIFTYASTIKLPGNSTFLSNSATLRGGGISARWSHFSFTNNSNFSKNLAESGGGIFIDNSTLDFGGLNTIERNSADLGGGIYMLNGTLILDGSNYFEECTARYEGGGIFTYASNINLPGNNTFLSNSATLRGGGITARQSHFSFTNSSNFSKNFAESGGGIFIDNSTLDFGGLNTIERNTANLGGGVHMLNSSLDFLGNNSFIRNNATKDGGGIYARENGIIYLSGSNSFQGNAAAERGGGLFVKDSNLTSWTASWTVSTRNAKTVSDQRDMNLPGLSKFCNNTAMMGGGLYSIDSTLELYSLNLTANMATGAGGGFATTGSTVNIIGSMVLKTNLAMRGGGMYFEDTKVSMIGRNDFNRNHAQYEGGAVYVQAGSVNFSGADHFVSNSAAMRGGSLSAMCTNLSFSGNTTIHRSKSQQGGAIHVVASSIVFERVTGLWNNSAQYGGAILSEKSTVSIGKPSCRQCLGSVVKPEPGISFINNTALWGGAMHLDHHSSIRFHPSACIHFNRNKAREYGGAIFVVDTVGENTCPPVIDLPSRNECFFHVISDKISQTGKVNLIFEGNTAGKSGSVLYGGMLNKCNNSYSEEYANTINLFNRSIVPENYTAETAAISSDPRMCFCSEGGSPECEYEVQNEDLFPGQKVNVSLIAVDQTYTPIQTDIHTNLISDEKHNSRVCESFSEEREGSCTIRSFTITSPRSNNKLLLYPTTASGNPIPAVLNVTFQDCPIGFEQSNSTYECICDYRLQKFTNTCDIETQTFLRTGRLNGTFWVNASFNNETLDGYIHHSQCPLNYCTKQQRFINLNNPDEQCDFNHAGLLCGKCRENFSLILGSFQCEECSSEYLALLIPFALAGVALVILLFLLKLTVATGTLHGLIFYANVVAANHHIFFPPDPHILARIFIAWLNLDLGIETCFYNGMDAYSKSCLQIVFPLYIWGIVGFLIYISKQSQRVTELLGTNPVAVLDTLFLLSYTKLLRTIITALSLTTLHYPQNDRVVWLYDASIPMPKLIPFFIAALIFLVFLVLPYTLLLLMGQWFCAVSDLKLRKSCCEKHPRMKLRLKAILDPYHAPYKPKHCYWIGLLLLLRCVLLLVSAFNISGEKDSVNLLAILSAVGVTLALLVLSGKVYRSWYLNALEVSFLLNLIILTAATYHVRLVSGDQAAVAYISVGVAFLTFVGIITYHINLRMKWKLQHLPRYFKLIKKSCKNRSVESKIDVENSNAQNNQQETRPPGPTMTVVDLRSPLDLIDADRDVIETVHMK